MVTPDDVFLCKLTAIREDAEYGLDGMRAVLHVIFNRAKKENKTPYDICTDVWQFSSISCPGFGNEPVTGIGDEKDILRLERKVNQCNAAMHILSAWAKKKDTKTWALWVQLDSLIDQIDKGVSQDITSGATMYYAVSMVEKPKWDFSKLVYTGTIGGHRFYKEV